MEIKVFSIASDFSKYPGGRFRVDGPFSGEQFREDKLLKWLSENNRIILDLDGTMGYGSSFLEEAFGGLTRDSNLNAHEIFDRIEFKSCDSSLILEIAEYMGITHH